MADNRHMSVRKSGRGFGTMSVASSSRRGEDGAHSTGLAAQESIKEKQQRCKEERENRSGRINNKMTSYLLASPCDYFSISKEDANNFILDDEEQVKLLEDFIGKDSGVKAILFYYHEAKIPKIESGRIFPKSEASENGTIKRLTITNGKNLKLKDANCCYFLKLKADIALTMRNIHEETNFGILDPKKEGSLIMAIRAQLNNIYSPALNSYENWGKLKESNEGRNQQLRFLANLELNINYLENADHYTKNVVFLAEGPSKEMLEMINLPAKQKDVASKPDKLKIIEDLISGTWCRQMEQVLGRASNLEKKEKVRHEAKFFFGLRLKKARHHVIFLAIFVNECATCCKKTKLESLPYPNLNR